MTPESRSIPRSTQQQAAGNHGGGAKLAGQPCEARVLLAARREVAGKAGKALGDGAVLEAALLWLDYHNTPR